MHMMNWPLLVLRTPNLLYLTSEFNEVAKGDLGKMRAEHFSVKFLLIAPNEVRAQRGRGEAEEVEFGFSYKTRSVII